MHEYTQALCNSASWSEFSHYFKISFAQPSLRIHYIVDYFAISLRFNSEDSQDNLRIITTVIFATFSKSVMYHKQLEQFINDE